MKLQQLRYAVEVFRRNLNVSEAADALFTSQPGVSKQIRLLEDELGAQIFIRSGKRIVAVTKAGQAILETAELILRHVQNIKKISAKFSDTQSGMLTIAATHSVLRFRLPETVAAFAKAFPDVQITLKQGSPDEIAEMVLTGEVDLAIGQDVPETTAELSRLSCGAWNYILLMPRTHPLAQKNVFTLNDLADLPLLTYSFAFDDGAVATRAFNRARLAWHTVFLSNDSEVLKQYIRLGLGVGLLDSAAYQQDADSDLVAINVQYLFEPCEYKILLRNDTLICSYTYDFIQHVEPNLNRERVNKLMYSPAVEDFSI
ncbi:LysR substrate-binding domain-containing protein [Kingella negevensis]|uniref:LysR substrate-binding domain-containing protein n=1 Tax=Kingella negevensis TaxID=1522312 RepID=UPI00254E28A2|nr:LysR substrate-binding domain-containing protein [Kingella negevensis]MDK4707972.1 LysR substrate-binding domain-containing protein [Kingella negevensis]MDK4709490.1 LysR substrate-binding domain-containing protein [Kingella negevensis]